MPGLVRGSDPELLKKILDADSDEAASKLAKSYSDKPPATHVAQIAMMFRVVMERFTSQLTDLTYDFGSNQPGRARRDWGLTEGVKLLEEQIAILQTRIYYYTTLYYSLAVFSGVTIKDIIRVTMTSIPNWS
eukprot:sb/3474979/